MSSLTSIPELPDLPTPNYEYITRMDRAKDVLVELEKYPILEKHIIINSLLIL